MSSDCDENSSNPFVVQLPYFYSTGASAIKSFRDPLFYYIDECSSECDSILSDTGSSCSNKGSSKRFDIPTIQPSSSTSQLNNRNFFKRSNNRLWRCAQPNDSSDTDSNSESSTKFNYIYNLGRTRRYKYKRSSVKRKSEMKRRTDSEIAGNATKRRKLEERSYKQNNLCSNASDSDDVFVSKKKRLNDAQKTVRNENNNSKQKHISDYFIEPSKDPMQNISDDEGISTESRNDSANEMVSGTQEINFGNITTNSTKHVQSRRDSLSTSNKSDSDKSDTNSNSGSISVSVSSNKTDVENKKSNRNNNRTDSSDSETDFRKGAEEKKDQSMRSSLNQDNTILKTPRFMDSMKSKATSTPLVNDSLTCIDKVSRQVNNKEHHNKRLELSKSDNQDARSRAKRRPMPKMVPAVERKQFEEELLFSEDLTDDDEIWVAQCPIDLKINSLLGVKFDMKGITNFSALTKSSKSVPYEAVASTYSEKEDDELQSDVYCLVPSKKNDLRFKTVQPCGIISIQEEVPVMAPSEIPVSVHSPPKLPENLRINHPLLGRDYSRQLFAVEDTIKKDPRKSVNKERFSSSRNYDENGVTYEDSPKKKHKKKHKEMRNEHEDDSFINNDQSVTYEDRNNEDSEDVPKKKHKKKYKEMKNQYEDDGCVNKQRIAYEDRNNEDAEDLPKKKHKKKHKEMRNKYEEDVVNDEEYINVTHLTENSNLEETVYTKKHKKHKKQKYKENESIEEPICNINETDYSEGEKSIKKHKKKKLKNNSACLEEENLQDDSLLIHDVASKKKKKKKKKERDV